MSKEEFQQIMKQLIKIKKKLRYYLFSCEIHDVPREYVPDNFKKKIFFNSDEEMIKTYEYGKEFTICLHAKD